MENELEVIGAASASAIARDKNGDGYLQGPCPNCGTELQGEFCSSCGQSAKDMKRPFVSLFADMLNAIVAFDGRLAKTLPALMFRPGHITRAHIDGKRVRYVPPFRLFLIASVIFFLTLFSLGERQEWAHGDDLTVNTGRSAISNIVIDGKPMSEIEGFDEVFDEEGNFDRAATDKFLAQLEQDGTLEPDQDVAELANVLEGIDKMTLSRSEMFASVRKWAPRLSFLLLPFTIISLTILHIWIRRIYIYDHVIVAMHLQTFIYLAATLAILFSAISTAWAWGIFGVSMPIYIMILLRKSYDTNHFLNFNRLIGLAFSTLGAVIVLIILVSVISANEVGLFTWDEFKAEVMSDE